MVFAPLFAGITEILSLEIQDTQALRDAAAESGPLAADEYSHMRVDGNGKSGGDLSTEASVGHGLHRTQLSTLLEANAILVRPVGV